MSDPRCRSVIVALVVLFTIGSAGTPLQPGAPAARLTENVILITLDGVRPQEIFGGLDLDVLRSTLRPDEKVEETRAYERYSAATPEARRERLMPFFWGMLMTRHGSIAGDTARGSSVRVTNRHWFSYPGYAEILTGAAHDDVIDSNDKKRNPYPTVLEFFKRKLKLGARDVAAFASWDTFDWIVAHEAGAVMSNAGFMSFDHPDRTIQLLNQLQTETETPWNGARHDAYTFRFAMAYLATYRPRVLYIALDETDDWAHDGRYDRVLDALNRTDGYLRELWDVLQREPGYRDRTAVLITVDHGRGETVSNWRGHGRDVPGSNNIWMAFVGPDWTRRGAWRDSEPLYQNQVAATLAEAVGLNYAEQNSTAGRPIRGLTR